MDSLNIDWMMVIDEKKIDHIIWFGPECETILIHVGF